MAKHAMKQPTPEQQRGTSNSRVLTQKIGNPSPTDQPDTLGGDGKGLGRGTGNSRYTSTKPGGNSGTVGPAMPRGSAPTFSPQNASVLGKNVYRSSKPAKK